MKKTILLYLGAFIAISLLFIPILSYFNKSSQDSISLSDLVPVIDEKQQVSSKINKIDKARELVKVLDGTKSEVLPIADVALFESDKSWGTVLYIPQNHRYPGTEVEDQKNDSAEITQKEIYKVLKFLSEKEGMDFVMAEGEMYGEINEEKLSELKEKILARNEFANNIEEVKVELKEEDISEKDKELFLRKAESMLSYLDREIILTGAPYKLKAEGEEINIFGSENKETRDECAEIVRNYIYKKDRLAQCSSGSAVSSVKGLNSSQTSLLEKLKQLKSGGSNLLKTGDLFMLDRLLDIKQLLKGGDKQSIAEKIEEYKKIIEKNLSSVSMSKGSSLDFKSLMSKNDASMISVSDFTSMENKAREKGNEILAKKLASAKGTYSKIKNRVEKKKQKITATPSRANNPYSSINDPEELQSMIKESEEKIQEVVVEQRNEETAENFAKALKMQGKNIGILQFGAGHEEGLVEELRKQGLDVVVVKTEEVLRREIRSLVN